jgi:hypothetical protein
MLTCASLTKIDRMHSHLLQCARRRRQKKQRERMMNQLVSVKTCLWNGCHYRFTPTGRTCGSYLAHITNHLKTNQAHQCLWNACYQGFKSFQELATHVSQEHQVPNEWTSHSSMHYCYEHDVWCHSNLMWDAHLHYQHLPRLNDFCGLIKECGVVVVAAHCLLCLGETQPLSVQFTQYHDIFDLHKHMTDHLARGIPESCPHPKCGDPLTSELDFWNHATSVHGVPPFGSRRVTRKRDTLEDGSVQLAKKPRLSSSKDSNPVVFLAKVSNSSTHT